MQLPMFFVMMPREGILNRLNPLFDDLDLYFVDPITVRTHEPSFPLKFLKEKRVDLVTKALPYLHVGLFLLKGLNLVVRCATGSEPIPISGLESGLKLVDDTVIGRGGVNHSDMRRDLDIVKNKFENFHEMGMDSKGYG